MVLQDSNLDEFREMDTNMHSGGAVARRAASHLSTSDLAITFGEEARERQKELGPEFLTLVARGFSGAGNQALWLQVPDSKKPCLIECHRRLQVCGVAGGFPRKKLCRGLLPGDPAALPDWECVTRARGQQWRKEARDKLEERRNGETVVSMHSSVEYGCRGQGCKARGARSAARNQEPCGM